MIITRQFYMNTLRRNREITIYLPDNYETSGKRYPVMYINDGQNAFFDDKAYAGVSWGFLDYVYRTGLEIILVAVPCATGLFQREAEYGVWKTGRAITILEAGQPWDDGLGGEGEAYLHFLMDELKPYMDATYPTDPEDTALVGSSAGGNITYYAALRYPEVFPKCAALSCAFWYYPEQYLALTQRADLTRLKWLYLDIGTRESDNEFVNNLYLYDMEMIYSALWEKPGRERVRFQMLEGARHNEGEWRKRVPAFMELFYGGQRQ